MSEQSDKDVRPETRTGSRNRDYTVVVEYLLPVWKTVHVQAESLEEACEKAVDLDSWEGASEDYDSSSSVYVAAVVPGKVDDPYCGCEHAEVPSVFSRKAAMEGLA